jgi:hypothetical protein
MTGAGLVCCVAALVALPAAQPRSDLVESAVAVARAGASLRVTDVVRNRGAVAAPRSKTGYYLGGLRVGGRSISALGPGAASRRSTTIPIPASLGPGTYRLRACADDGGRIRESNERNNCRAAPQLVKITGAPVFAGLRSATTCIPGPVGGNRTASYRLAWDPATDDDTPSSDLVYEVYQATAPGAEDFSAATYTTPAGATTFATPPLPADKAYYFVVRARDRAGHRDANRVERVGENLCL